jgi:sensor histidine kinase YesM
MKTRLTYWACQIAGWGAYAAIGTASAAQVVGWRVSLVTGYALFAVYSIALTDLLRREIRRRDWLNARFVFWRLAGAAILLAAIQTFLVVAINLGFDGKRSTFLENPSYIASTWVSVAGANAVWLLLYIAFTSRRRFREKEVRLELALKDAELRALEAQVNPHFLFNCLNSVRALVKENPAQAQDMITRLANLLRYSLHRDLNHTVPLAGEVEMAGDYLALESVRFEDRLRVQMAVDPEATQFPVPPMLLQTLVENALKHGIGRLPAGGEVLIRAKVDGDGLLLEVENSGQLNGAPPRDTQLGLRNTRERLRILYGGRASLEIANRDGTRVAATVHIPRTTA